MEARLSFREPVTWALLGLGALFCGLGLFFLLLPGPGAELFGLPAAAAETRSYARAVALRDIALALYLVLQTLFAPRRAVLILLAATMVIPIGDLMLLLTSPGAELGRWPLHLASAACFAGTALWVRTSARASAAR